MSLNISRKDKTLNDAIEVLNEPLIKANNDINLAWQYVRQYPDQLEFITTELERCLDRDYFLENYYCIRTENGQIKTMYPYWDHQYIIAEAMDEEWSTKGFCLIIILKPRQCGATEWTSASMFHRTIFTPNAFTLSVAQDDETKNQIFKKMNNAYHYLPWWMRPTVMFRQEGNYIEFQEPDEDKRITNPGLGSAILVEHAQKMTGVAIGKTIRNFHGSEVSRWPDAELFTADIEPSMNADDEYGVLESTAYGRTGLYAKHWEGAVKGKNDWRALFVPVYRVRKYAKVGERYLRAQQNFELNNVEKSFNATVKKEQDFEIPDSFWAWRRRRLESTVSSTGVPWSHFESYPITPDEAFQSSGVCAFDRLSLQYQRLRHVTRPLWVGEIKLISVEAGTVNTDSIREIKDGEVLEQRKNRKNTLLFDRLWVWEWPDPKEFYYVSSDTALGVIGGDYSVCEVWRAGMGGEPDTQVAEWWGHCPPTEFATFNAALGIWYHGSNSASEIATEYQGPGISCGDKLKDLDYPNLYRMVHKDRVTNAYTNWWHWMTNQKTRDLIISTMNEALLAHTVVIRSEDLIDEMYDFGSDEGGGRMEGQDNFDDGVMSAQIGLYCLRETTRDLKQYSEQRDSDSELTNDLNVYGVYDELRRQRGQYSTKQQALEVIKDKPKWQVLPVMICKSNTLFSPIFQGSGPERTLHKKFGIPSTDILPELVHSFKAVIETGGYGDDDGDDW